MEHLKKGLDWVIDDLKNNNIKLSLKHNTHLKKVLNKEIINENDFENKVFNFLYLFSTSLRFNEKYPEEEIIAFGETCKECGKNIHFIFNTKTKELSDCTRTPFSKEIDHSACEKIRDYSFEIEVPSGNIICTDRLPYSYDMLKHLDGKITLNSNAGLKERTLNYAKENILHVFVGNSSPDVFKKDGFIYIGHSLNNEINTCSCGAEYGCDCEYEEYYPIEGSNKIADICTDLWWASIVDLEIYKKLLSNYFNEETANSYIKELKPIETKITPGIYKCTSFRMDEYDNYYDSPILVSLELKKKY